MSLLDYPVGQERSGEFWPALLPDQPWANAFGSCPICDAYYTSYFRLSCGTRHQSGIPPESLKGVDHLAYQCGGVWKEMPDKPGFWGGKCGNRRLLRQRLLEFVFSDQP
jgi:hypothetical protein